MYFNYRRKLIRQESNKLFALFNEESGVNTNVILSNSVSNDEIVDFNHAFFDETEQNTINLPFPDLTIITNITNRTNIKNISASDVSI